MSITQTDIITNYHKIKYQIDRDIKMDLMTQYQIAILKFFRGKGYDPKVQNIRKARDQMDRMINNANLSPKEAFIQIIKKYFNEQMLEEIYFDLFKYLIWKPISREEFRNLSDFEYKCLFVFKKIPSHAKNTFTRYFYGFAICHLQNKRNYQIFKKSEILDNDTNSIVKQYMF